MYRKDSEGWLKHVDFMVLDMICLQLAFILAYALRGKGMNLYGDILYRRRAGHHLSVHDPGRPELFQNDPDYHGGYLSAPFLRHP